MKRAQTLLPMLAVLLLASSTLCSAQGPVRAQPAAAYDLSWWTVDGGGVTLDQPGGYSLGATAGQPDAAVWLGQPYSLAGGFWGSAALEYRIYLPVVLRNH